MPNRDFRHPCQQIADIIATHSRPERSQGSGDVVLEIRNLRLLGGLKPSRTSASTAAKRDPWNYRSQCAGKTTLFNLLNGFLRPGTGEFSDGRDMSAASRMSSVSRRRRTFQIMRPFLRMSISDNVVVGAYVRAKPTPSKATGEKRLPASDFGYRRALARNSICCCWAP